jgi:hypothetical protein
MKEMCWKSDSSFLLVELGSGSWKGLKVIQRVGFGGVVVVVLVFVGNLACND